MKITTPLKKVTPLFSSNREGGGGAHFDVESSFLDECLLVGFYYHLLGLYQLKIKL